MHSKPINEALEKERAFLRIPIKVPIKIFIKERFYKNAFTHNLSSTGLSFYIEETAELPDFLELHLYLLRFLKTIKIKCKVKNRKSISGSARIGCEFLEISERNNKLIGDYVTQFSNFSLPCKVLNVAAFVLFVDALWRLFLYMINSYYQGTMFVKSFALEPLPRFYIVILSAYAILTFTTFIFIENITKRNFVLNISCIMPAFIFILIKNITYWKLHLWQSHYLPVTIFFWIQLVLVIYVALVIGLGLASFRRINFVLNSVRSYQTKFRHKLDKTDSIV